MKKIFSVLVTLTLVFSLLPTTFAVSESENLVNLALNKSYTLETPYQIDSHFSPVENGHPDDTGRQLTDGIFGGTTFSNKAYVGRIWQGSRVVTIDLEKNLTIQEISVNVLQDIPVGIFFPKWISYSISTNGVAWEDLGKVNNAISTTAKGPITHKIARKDINKVARYIKVEIPVASWLFMDEIEVLGTEDESGEKLIPSPNGPKAERGYPKPGSSQVRGIKNEVLIYTGEWQYQPSDWISFDKEDFKPYVSYVDKGMKRKDYMFDGFLFLPYAPQMDGSTFAPTGAKPSNKTHWEDYIDRLFRDEYELGALNEAVKEAKAELPNRNYEAKAVIAIPYPRPDQSNFGDVDGDGISENLNVSEIGEEKAHENRVKVVNWFIDEVTKRYSEEGYDDLSLVGFYWYNEYVSHQLSELDHELIQSASKYVKEKNLTFQWIPYYFARGWDDWKELGFDSALLQPNYFFHGNSTIDRLDTIAKAAYNQGMGIEIELSDSVLTSEAARKRYYAYLNKGVEHHYMIQSYSGFYQQVKTLLQAANSMNPAAREVYDRTYEYIKGTYQPIK
ncbi:DUF4855 domain-containing protein [Fredinandcohnia humi]